MSRFLSRYRKKRIYHIHIRKSAGTSVNSAFWAFSDYNLQNAGKRVILEGNNFVCVRHHFSLINSGCYNYANSHAAYWKLKLPENTLTLTVFRDPLNRLISLYKYYYWHENESEQAKVDPQHSSVLNYTHWLGGSFMDFLDNVPKMHISNQLYMFSECFDVNEALNNVSKLSKVYFQDNLKLLEADFKQIMGDKFVLKRERSYNYQLPFELSQIELNKAKSLLSDEYLFYKEVRTIYASKK